MIKQLSCLLAALFGFTASVRADSPNIILILTDDQGWSQRSGLMDPENPESGSSYLHTPAMADHMTLPRALKQANPEYQCAHFGKWGEKMISSPDECGYDASDGPTGNVTGGMADKIQPAHIVEDPKRIGTATDRTIEFMREQTKAGKPFYAQVSYYAVHLRTELSLSDNEFEKKTD
ncbi:MAG: hypothetical protein Aurels2KO_46700 [Aureliella sp.]